MKYGNSEEAVSPVIGVMLMIVVTVIIAGIVSAFAGGYANEDKKAPTAVISCKYMPATGVSSTSKYFSGTINSGTPIAIPYGGLLFTHEGGDYLDLENTYLVVSSGDASRKFIFTTLQKANARQYDKAAWYSSSGIMWWSATDQALNTGNQFALAGEDIGSSGPTGTYLGWSSSPALYLTDSLPATFTLVDKETGRTISSGRIEYDG